MDLTSIDFIGSRTKSVAISRQKLNLVTIFMLLLIDAVLRHTGFLYTIIKNHQSKPETKLGFQKAILTGLLLILSHLLFLLQ